MRARIAGANINEQSLLATDYLNHFNEVAMIVEMLPDMPDFVEEVKSWELKSYKQHFQDSTFSDKDLAVAAYDCVPTPYLIAFEGAVKRAAELIQGAVPNFESAIGTGEREQIEVETKKVCTQIEFLMSQMRSIVNGELVTLQQDEIDEMLSQSEEPSEVEIKDDLTEEPMEGLDQDYIDSLFD